MKAAIEIEPYKFLLAINGEKSLRIFNPSKGITESEIANPTENSTYFSMLKCPGFDYITRPYVFLKERNYIHLIDVRDKKMCPIIRSNLEIDMTRQPNFEISATMPEKGWLSRLTFQDEKPDELMVEIYTLEYSIRRNTSNIKKYNFDITKAGQIISLYADRAKELLEKPY